MQKTSFLDGASREKCRIEDKQRETAAKNRRGGDDHQVLWFKPDKHPEFPDTVFWMTNNKYWDRDYSQCPQIFSNF